MTGKIPIDVFFLSSHFPICLERVVRPAISLSLSAALSGVCFMRNVGSIRLARPGSDRAD